ncbi:unnamed protein product [Clavelina lepadiformis]|uniref:RING-type domain-containing protein n=1 Tax=Clavelina lepadiformis TaxID=159417 RepID=A0ABP0GI98_CLALP
MDSTERDISCAICPDTLKPPIRILPCLHSVCESCVKELLQSNTNDPKCQKCDGNITLEVEEIENLPLNRLLQIYIEMYINKTCPLSDQINNSSQFCETLLRHIRRISAILHTLRTRILEEVEESKRAAEEVEKLKDEIEASLKI